VSTQGPSIIGEDTSLDCKAALGDTARCWMICVSRAGSVKWTEGKRAMDERAHGDSYAIALKDRKGIVPSI